MKRILLTGGGTAGHVTPNLALIPELLKRGWQTLYIGRKSGIEKDLIEAVGIEYRGINAGKLRRYFDIQNFIDIFRIGMGFLAAMAVLRRIRPHLVFSKGGFVSCPVVWAARLQRIPIIIHESDITPGLANRLSAPFATKICYSFPETAGFLPKTKAVYTGIPVRNDLLNGDPQEGGRICGFSNLKPVILVIGGSQGSEAINRTVRSSLSQMQEKYQICHICGKGGVDRALRAEKGYKQFEYVDRELAHLFAMAELVVSRAGATTLFEILALKKPNLLIPLSLKASRGDQIENAASFVNQGFSRMLAEEKLDPASLIIAVDSAFASKDEMMQKMNNAASMNAIEKILELMDEFIQISRG